MIFSFREIVDLFCCWVVARLYDTQSSVYFYSKRENILRFDELLTSFAWKWESTKQFWGTFSICKAEKRRIWQHQVENRILSFSHDKNKTSLTQFTYRIANKVIYGYNVNSTFRNVNKPCPRIVFVAFQPRAADLKFGSHWLAQLKSILFHDIETCSLLSDFSFRSPTKSRNVL